MANFRAERLFIRVDEGEIVALIKSGRQRFRVRARRFAIRTCLAVTCLPTSHSGHRQAAVVSGERRTQRRPVARIAELESNVKAASKPKQAALQQQLDVLHAVEDRLDIADSHDRKFHFLVRDLA